MGVLGETLTYWQILSCELPKNAFGGRVPPEPAGRAIAYSAPRDPLAVIGEGKEGKGRKGLKIVGTERRGWEGADVKVHLAQSSVQP